MDSFIDRFAQRRNAQDMIKANAMAEAEEKERMAERLAEYEEMLCEIRKSNLQNLENAEKVKELLTASLQKIDEVQKKDEKETGNKETLPEEIKKLLEEQNTELQKLFTGDQKIRIQESLEEQKTQIRESLEEQKTQIQEFLEEQKTQMQESLEEQKKMIEEFLASAEDANHKEAVKVYRNVQAAMEEAMTKQTKEIVGAIAEAEESKMFSGGLVAVWIITLIAAFSGIGLELAQIFGFL